MSAPSLVVRRLFRATAVAGIVAWSASLTAQIPTRNVNMVSGLEYPGGDPFMQRQNEPSVAVSTRNPMHLLGGANDYRSVDFPIALSDNDGEIGDAWLGLFKSTDGGERWSSTLLPGHPYDHSPEGLASPLRGHHAGADPVVRAGTNGLMYYAGLVFDRSANPAIPGKSAIFVARYIDNNNQESGDPFEYAGTTLVTSNPGGTTGVFLDKPWMAVDIPRQGGGGCAITTNGEDGPFTQRLPSGNIYVAFTVKSVDAQGTRWDLYFSRSTDCGARFSAPIRVSRPQDRVNQGATIVIAPNTGEVFVAWRRIDLVDSDTEEHAIVVARSTDQGRKFNPPGVARRFPRGKKKGLDPAHFKNNGNGNAQNAGVAQEIAVELAPFDQGSSAFDLAFRTNAYPTMAADATGRLYLAWTERGFALHPDRQDPFSGDARIMLSTSTDGATWSGPARVADDGQQGHQIMPALSFAGGKLMLAYYDLQEDYSGVFKKYVDDKTAFEETAPNRRRHTIDIRVSMASPAASPVFDPSRSVSSYMYGTRTGSSALEAMQKNPPNLPMFRLGTTPFIGDYIDLAPAPAFVPTAGGGWTYNTAATSTAPVFHVAWTDNRDVRPPLDKDWTRYTPPTYSGPRPDPGAPIIVCEAGYAGSRNQNIYTARITGGLIVGSPGNSKQLNTQFARAFVVFARNTTDRLAPRVFRMTILNQPPGGRASFSQFPAPPFTPSSLPPLTMIDVTIPRFTTASRTVYVTSTDPGAPISVDVSEIDSVGAPGETPGGLEGLILLNPDILNPEVENPEVENPEVENPEVENAEVYNPEVENPEVENPEVENPEVENHEIANPEVENPEVENILVGNPDLDNPEVENPEVENPEVENPEVENPEVENAPLIANGGVITDITWTIKNIGNTTTSYNVNLFLRRHTTPSTGSAQLLIYRLYKTPVIKFDSCVAQTVTQHALIANIPSPTLVFPNGEISDPNDSDENSATMWIEPGKEVLVTLRVFDPDLSNNIIVDGASIDPEWVPDLDVSLVLQPQPVNTDIIPPGSGPIEPPVVTSDPVPPLVVTTTADAGPGSFRDAIAKANTTPGTDTIVFNIPGPGPHTIMPNNTFGTISEAVIIDGSTQPGYAGTPIIVLDGSLTGGGSALRLEGGSSLVRALVLNNWGDVGVNININGANRIYGNYIGVDHTGVVLASNGTGGISAEGDGNIIGGSHPLDRNVISGNSFWGVELTGNNNLVEGNYIGVDATGNAVIPNVFGVIANGSGSRLVGNTISGHASHGVFLAGPMNVLEGNRIGTNAAGTVELPNAGNGVYAAARSMIGGVGSGNLISGNDQEGIYLAPGSDDSKIVGNLIGVDQTASARIDNFGGIGIHSDRVHVGGTAAGEGNVISGNALGNYGIGVFGHEAVIEGNKIGTDGAGLSAIPNGGGILVEGNDVRVGGFAPGAGNLISGNNAEGIYLSPGAPPLNPVGTQILNNRIGTTASSNAPLPNRTGIGVISVATTTIHGNVISGNDLRGVLVVGSNDLSFQNNIVGMNALGTVAVGNTSTGLYLFTSHDIAVASNIFSANTGAGIQFDGLTFDVSIRSNKIGTDITGTALFGNGGDGILVGGTASVSTIGVAGQENKIRGNGGAGVLVGALSNTIFIGPNDIRDNGGLEIDLGGDGVTANDGGDGDGGPNERQNYPVLTGANKVGALTFVSGTLNSTFGSTFTVQLFLTPTCDASGFGGSQTLQRTFGVVTDVIGNAAFNDVLTGIPTGWFLTATATDSAGNTSEFSACRQVVEP